MLVMKELARREATLGIVTMNVIMELRLQDQIKNDERVLHGQRMNTAQGRFDCTVEEAILTGSLLVTSFVHAS
ncbi:hypothetical protein glysoja_014716 [Glycine soja]|nr:hypothetical protein glysoja_014716 [Glycine soja]